MSLQNLLKPNNYELYINSNTIVSSDIMAGSLSALTDPGTIELNSGLSIPTDKDQGIIIGNNGGALGNIYTYNIVGPDGVNPFNVPAGISGETIENPPPTPPTLVPISIYNGLALKPLDTSSTLNSSTIDQYGEYSGSLTFTGPFSGTAGFRGVICGSKVTISLNLNQQHASAGLPAGTGMVFEALPSRFHPQISQIVLCPVYNGVVVTGCIFIETNGVMSMFPSTIFSPGFTSSAYPCGLGIPDGNSYVFSYLLN